MVRILVCFLVVMLAVPGLSLAKSSPRKSATAGIKFNGQKARDVIKRTPPNAASKLRAAKGR